MSNYHHNTNPSFMIYGGSIDPIASPTVFAFDDSVSMAHSQSAHSYGSSPGSTRDSFFDNRYLQTSSTAGTSPNSYNTPLRYADPYLYTANYGGQSPVRPMELDPHDIDFDLTDSTSWMLDSEPTQAGSYGTSNTGTSSYGSQASSYEPPPSQVQTTGYVGASSHSPSHRQSSTSEKGRFMCTVKGCTSKGRFSRKTDLTRHIASVHGSKRFDCPHRWCGRHGDNGFTRMDHRREHLREVHQKTIPPKSVRGASRQ